MLGRMLGNLAKSVLYASLPVLVPSAIYLALYGPEYFILQKYLIKFFLEFLRIEYG